MIAARSFRPGTVDGDARQAQIARRPSVIRSINVEDAPSLNTTRALDEGYAGARAAVGFPTKSRSALTTVLDIKYSCREWTYTSSRRGDAYSARQS